jgi:hypothetical protein
MARSALIIIPAKRGVLAPTPQRGSKGGRSASRVLAETMIKAARSKSMIRMQSMLPMIPVVAVKRPVFGSISSRMLPMFVRSTPPCMLYGWV